MFNRFLTWQWLCLFRLGFFLVLLLSWLQRLPSRLQPFLVRPLSWQFRHLSELHLFLVYLLLLVPILGLAQSQVQQQVVLGMVRLHQMKVLQQVLLVPIPNHLFLALTFHSPCSLYSILFIILDSQVQPPERQLTLIIISEVV